MRFRFARATARALRWLSRRLGRTGGTTAPGRVLLRLEPHALERMGAGLEDGAVLVSATNGKTTTAAMIAAILERAGRPVVHNRAGSNMSWGVATALLDAGRAPGQTGLLEVDEAWLPQVASALPVRTCLLSNLFRDQLDRYGELEVLADRWAEMVAALTPATRFVLNADDPLVADLGRGREDSVLYFGTGDDTQAVPELQHAADSKHCRNCGHPYVYDAVYLGHMGRYHCANCGRTRPDPAVVAHRVRLRGMSGADVAIATPEGELDVSLSLPGLYNVYNAVAAAAVGLELGATLEQVGGALEGFGGAFGRVETIPMPTPSGPRDVMILLVKNPAGANEVLRTMTLEAGELDLWIALNDRIADGRDVSWIWDADFELLRGRVRRVTCSGTRAEEMALRLKYAGVAAEAVTDGDLGGSLDRALADGEGPLYALPTYTALLDMRRLLSERGLAASWAA